MRPLSLRLLELAKIIPYCREWRRSTTCWDRWGVLGDVAVGGVRVGLVEEFQGQEWIAVKI